VNTQKAYPTPSLLLQDVVINRGSRCVLPRLNLRLEPGHLMGVLGPNGSGKTSLLKACVGELALAGGAIYLNNQRLDQHNAKQLSRLRAVLPQSVHLTFDLPVHELIQMGAYPFVEIAQSDVRLWTEQAIEIADVAPLMKKRFAALSGGQQQRVQFARVMLQILAIKAVNGHAFLLLDEPTANLDPKHQGLLIRAVRDLTHSGQVGALVILHDLNIAARWCDRVLLIAENQTPVLGSPAAVFTEKTLKTIYGIKMLVGQHPVRPNQLLILENEH
jgi:iron complex transport system ATP-binding protein